MAQDRGGGEVGAGVEVSEVGEGGMKAEGERVWEGGGAALI